MRVKKYRIKELAKISGVSVRTLHHYDHIGLLTPKRSDNGYRHYGDAELMRLQQILFYKTLNISLDTIKSILDDPYFDQVKSLRQHKKSLLLKIDHFMDLIQTIDKTIGKLTNKETMTNDELYQGFSQDQQKEYRAEAVDKWGDDAVTASEERLRKLGKQGLQNLKDEATEINQRLASLMHLNPKDQRVQDAIKVHFNHLNAFRKIEKDEYGKLGVMYVEDPRFTAYYDKYASGLADFLNRSIQVFTKT